MNPKIDIEPEEFEFEDRERTLIHEWRAEQLGKLGISWTIAQAVAGLVDWHDLARLVERGCSPELALEIVR